jgi:hypothetical protein
MATVKSLSVVAFPIQKLPLSKKNKEWREGSLDAVIAREGHTGLVGGQTRTDRMKIAYDLYNSVFDEKDLKYVTDPFKVEDGFPASLQNFNIIRPKVDLLLGEESKRPDSIRVIQTNDEAAGRVQNERKDLIMSYISDKVNEMLGQGTPDISEEEQLTELENYMLYDYNDLVEKQAFHTLEYLREKLKLTNEFLKGWKDALIAGEEVYYIGTVWGDPILERVNPILFTYDADPDLEFIEDGEWALRRMYLSPSAIYDRFHDIMTPADLDKVLDMAGQRSMHKNTGSDVNTTTIYYRDRVFSDLERQDGLEGTLVSLWHGTWRSFKKVGFLKYIDEEGEEQETMVDETYKPSLGEDITWDWITEIWEGYRIGEDIYVGIQPVEYQHVSVDNPNSQKLPYTGVAYSGTNTRSKSLVDIMKPLQYMYIVVWYRLELALSRDKGKVLNMDVTQIPKSMGVDFNKWAHYLTAMGVNLINPYEEGWDVPGREGGHAAAFNQMSSQDLSMTAAIAEYIELMNKIEEMAGELSGVSKQRQGAIEQRELVGNVERAVIQSSHITEPLFWLHNQAKQRAMTLLLDCAKSTWANSGKEKLHYVLGDLSRAVIDIDSDFLYSDTAIFVSDSTKENRDIESLKTLLQPAMQNGAGLMDIANILTADNMTQIKRRLAELDKRRERIEQEAAQREQEAQMQIQQMQAEAAAEDMRIKEEDSIRKADTAIQVALINAESRQGEGGEEGDEATEQAKLDLQRDKQSKESEIKTRQQQEDERKNRRAEAQRQQEIEIKRKQANKPAATNSK